jgi:APA family basic amino acid/polyamine antiporter
VSQVAGHALATEGRSSSLRKTIGKYQYFALGFGTIIGSAWVVVLGDWLRMAGPGGAMLGFLAGGLLMSLIAAVYAELTARMPEAGGEFLYAYRLFGPRTGFFVGWFVTLYLITVTAFEAVALPWMLQALMPGMRGPVLYSLLGENVTLDAVLVGVGGVLLITYLNFRDVRLAVMFQAVVTYGFLAAAALVIVAGAHTGEAANLQPLFSSTNGESWWLGAFWIFANCAFFLNGFQAIPQAIEERAHGISGMTIAKVMVGSVVLASLFYCAIVVSSSLAKPWESLAASPLATAAAVEDILPDGMLAKLVLLTAAASLLKTWNAIALMASRILMAQGREKVIPAGFAALHPRYATPTNAVLFVGVCSLAGVFMGRGAILPLVNTASICMAFSFLVGCFGVLKLRSQESYSHAEFRVPGGATPIVLAILASGLMAAIAFGEPAYRQRGGVPLEWILMSIWGVVGVVFWKIRRARA